jgi:peptide-methionine (S)-S-oxide reductase
VTFDPSKVSYDRLLDIYWHNIDPITRDRQFCDQGSEYRTVIFYANDAQRAAAERSLREVQKHFTKPVVTEIVPAGNFYRAEDYHQHFADRFPDRYNAYRRGCGRDARLRELWGVAAEPNVPPLPPS